MRKDDWLQFLKGIVTFSVSVNRDFNMLDSLHKFFDIVLYIKTISWVHTGSNVVALRLILTIGEEAHTEETIITALCVGTRGDSRVKDRAI